MKSLIDDIFNFDLSLINLFGLHYGHTNYFETSCFTGENIKTIHKWHFKLNNF